jgi:hypothetical protein
VTDAVPQGFASKNDLYGELANYTGRVTLVRAASERETISSPFLLSPTYPALAARFTHVRSISDELVQHTTHFIPMEDPALVAIRVDAAVAALTKASL